MKKHEAEAVSHIRERRIGKTQFNRIDENPGATDRVTSLLIAWAGLIDGEAAMRLRAAGVKSLLERDHLLGGASPVLLSAEAGIAGDHPFPPSHLVVAGIGHVYPVEVHL